MTDRTPLGDPAPTQLVAARLVLHYAAQPFAAASYALHAPREDHSQTNLLWSVQHRAFLGRPLPSGNRLVYDPVHLHTGFRLSDDTARVFDIAGLTLEECFARLADLARSIGEPLEGALELPAYDLPHARYAEGAVFTPPNAATVELVRWFDSAFTLLHTISADGLTGTEVRGWPHHFDLADFVPLDEDQSVEGARSINVGFSPGDESIAEPYYYVTPWPAPNADDLPALKSGARWHTEGFTAAVITGTTLFESDADPLGLAAAAVREGVRVARRLLDR